MTLNRNRAPTVQLDGEKVRTIRENSELTQLYIAEVVGVSVDTVSRWENNRTDGVRTENARALAQALEVDFDDVLRAGEASEALPSKRRTGFFALILLLLVVLVAVGYSLLRPASMEVKAVRLLPPYTAPGSQVPIAIDLTVVSGEPGRVVVREKLPAGWTLSGAVPKPDQGPNGDNVVKWILPLEAKRARVVYLAQTPPNAEESTAHRFSGELVTAGSKAPSAGIGGESRIDLEYVHWADEDADFTIDDGEVLLALERMEFAKELKLDPADLRRLWGAGEYQWEQQAGEFSPVKPVGEQGKAQSGQPQP